MTIKKALNIFQSIVLIILLSGPCHAQNNTNTAPAEIRTTFTIHAPNAKSVQVAGNFNGWTPQLRLEMIDGETWQGTTALPAGYYYYKFVVDGRWISDPENPEKVNEDNQWSRFRSLGW